MKSGIIFDLDGTLWNTSEQVVPAWNIVLTKHKQKNITNYDMNGFMGKTLDTISQLMLPHLPHKQAMDILYECCNEEQVYLSQHGGTLYPDLEKTLHKLSETYQLFIVSNCQSGYLDAFFTAHKLKDYFLDYECNGNTGLPKSENIKLVVSRNNLEYAVYVGDTELDMESAIAAGVPFIFAKYGFGNIDNTTYNIDSISDLTALDMINIK
ncbi:MAG: HAD family hydrolase [Ruminococcus sp.]|nr:HAD family hydrolase [Ruminococcus sp.]